MNRMAKHLDTHGYEIAKAAVPGPELARWAGLVDANSRPLARNLLAHPRALTMAHGGAVRACVEPILGPAFRCVRGLLFDKPPGRNWLVAWHQDTMIAVDGRPVEPVPGYSAWSIKRGIHHVRPPVEVLESMVTLRLSLDAADAANGALKILPRTHLRGVLDSDSIAKAREASAAEVLSVDAGDIVVMRPLLLHASAKAEAPSRRRVVHLEFTSVELPYPLEWPHWGAG